MYYYLCNVQKYYTFQHSLMISIKIHLFLFKNNLITEIYTINNYEKVCLKMCACKIQFAESYLPYVHLLLGVEFQSRFWESYIFMRL